MTGPLIVGIGSSAGGLDAMQKLFRALPPDSGLAFVIAAHLDPTHESHLTEILTRCTKMAVGQVDADVRVEPNSVYVIAPDQSLAMADGILRPVRPSEPRGERRPVDGFFQSLAEDQGERAIAIVLSGTGTNGSLGLRFVKSEGGVVMAQDPETATFAGMPRNAIATGLVDLVLAPEEMAAALVKLAQRPSVSAAEMDGDQEEDDQLPLLLKLIADRAKRDFRFYKKRTLRRRVYRRMGLRQISSMGAYIERLGGDEEELAALVADLTINVSGFFRDPDAWKALEADAIAPLVAQRAADTTIRIWVPACATGEEAYSVAMLLIEQASAIGKSFIYRIFATDVSESTLSLARTGLYPASIAQDIAPERLERFFDREDDSYRVSKSLREMITIAPQNLLQDPPFSQIDVISCRNLLIYLEPDVQGKLLALFHFALKPDGYLFLGSAESITGQERLYRPISKKWRIFGRMGHTGHDAVDFPLVRVPDAGVPGHPGAATAAGLDPQVRSIERFHRALLDKHAPASVLIDRRFFVHSYHGATGDYLQQPGGEPTSNVLALAREGLEVPIRAVVQRAIQSGRHVHEETRVKRGRAYHPVRVTATPLRQSRGADGMMVVSFLGEETAENADSEAVELTQTDDADLEAELSAARADLRTTIEQMETSNEELKSSYEEIRSINEELQASNEELETSQEELHSLNEELRTINGELQDKVKELESRTDDLNNLLNSTDLATLFLDLRLRIRWFTPAMKSLVDLLPTDIGRPIYHFAAQVIGSDLSDEARAVLQSLVPRKTEVLCADGRCLIRKILPYRTQDNRIDGVVVTFMDITERRQGEQQREHLAAEIQHRAKNLLGVVQSLAAHASSDDRTPEAYRQAFLDRLYALSKVHLLLERENDVTDVGALIASMIEAFSPDGPETIVAAGPRVSLVSRQAVALGMVLHELSMNALKHGALATKEGQVRITWSLDAGAEPSRLQLQWEESGGPPPDPKPTKGFGSELIYGTCEHTLGGSVALDYRAEGLRCTVDVPLD